MIKDATGVFGVDQTIVIRAPRERVFELITDPVQAKRWCAVTDLEGRVGGKYRMEKGEWIAVGQIVEWDPPRAVAWTWDWQNAPIGARTVVRFELTAQGDSTTVHLTHTGFPDEEWAGDHAKGWTHYGNRLKIVAEGGDPGPDNGAM